jgi:SNF2 family DNA or RNA helicase
MEFEATPLVKRLTRPEFREAIKLADGLYPHQIEGVAFLLGRRRTILADDMGLGKTRQSIVALRHAEPGGPYLVVCPASVKLNWQREIAMVDAAVECRILYGKGDAPLRKDFTGWAIINYDMLGRRVDELKRLSWCGLVFDEAHYLKNHHSQRSKHARSLTLVDGKGPVVHALTGTPLTNRPRDLFPLLQLVRHPLGTSFLSFAKRYCDAEHNGFGWVTDGASNLGELTVQLHGIMMRRRKDEVLDLPPKVRTWLDVPIPQGTAAAEFRDAVEALLLAKNSSTVGSGRIRLLAKLTKARQKIAIAKVPLSIDLIEGILDQGEKAIVFSCYDGPVQMLAEHFGDRCVKLTGATQAKGRQSLVDRFQQTDSVRLFVANIVAGGIGLNLTAARHVVFNDLDWVPANHWQAEDRAYRIGQTHTVNVHYLVAKGTVDEFVQRVLETKAMLVNAVVEGEALSPGATRDVLAELEELVARMSPKLADSNGRLSDEAWLTTILEEAGRSSLSSKIGVSAAVKKTALSREAILALVRVLTRPGARVFKVRSNSDNGRFYALTYEAGEVSCTCSGFEYRGMCSHARSLKQALVGGCDVPAGYEEEAQA